jgi:hypothetical protein
VAENWHTFAGRLQWAIDRQPRQGRGERGLRLFQRRLARSAEGNPNVQGTSLSTIQTYLRGNAEPSPAWVELAALLLAVRAPWLAWGAGAPTEEEEAGRRGEPEPELARISTIVYRALGIPTEIPAGTPTHRHPEGAPHASPRFFASAVWAPLVRQTALRLYQHRPAWLLVEGNQAEYEVMIKNRDASFWLAVDDTAEAIAAPLRAVGINAEHLDLSDVADYIQETALALHSVQRRYVPAGRAQSALNPLVKALLDDLDSEDPLNE